jgi:hypothetical protein
LNNQPESQNYIPLGPADAGPVKHDGLLDHLRLFGSMLITRPALMVVAFMTVIIVLGGVSFAYYKYVNKPMVSAPKTTHQTVNTSIPSTAIPSATNPTTNTNDVTSPSTTATTPVTATPKKTVVSTKKAITPTVSASLTTSNTSNSSSSPLPVDQVITPAVTPIVPLGVSGNWNLIFDDEFNKDSSLNTTTWSPDWFGSGNTQNGTKMLSSNVIVSGGYLNLDASGAEGASGSIISTNPDDYQTGHTGFQYTYGFAEAKIDLPASGSKIANWPAFWADGQDWPTDGEMDIMEGLGGSACYHFHDTSGAPGACVSGNYTGWHTFGANWQPGSVTYYYDGVEVGQITTGITSEPMFLMLENSTGSYGNLPVTTPSDMKVAYVRVWQ